DGARRGDARDAPDAHRRRGHQGLFDAHLTLLPPGRAPGAAYGGRLRAGPVDHDRSDRVPRAVTRVPGHGRAEDRHQRSRAARRGPRPALRSRAAPLLFTYGTLMRGYALHPVLARGATFVEQGRMRGRLLDLGRYPGLIDGRGTVRGELYRIDAPEVLPALDREEGYNFDRRPATVTRTSGRRARAWVYWY